MDRSRPRLDPSVAATRRAVRPYVGEPVVVACSGGPDSLALAAAVAFEAPGSSLITIDHGLQDGSAERAAGVVALGESLGLRSRSIRVSVGTDGGPEAAARTARYAALDGERVLLGHTLDDQAETVLLGLGRGSGPRSIAGMAAVDGRWLRPFLGLRRSVTVAACAAQGLPTWDDPHNADPRFQRSRVRHEVLPLLEEALQGGVAEALARTAELLRDDLDTLDSQAAAALAHATDDDLGRTPRAAGGPAEIMTGLAVAAVAELPRAVRTRVLRAWAAAQGAGPLSSDHTAALDALVVDWHGQGPIPLPGGVSVRRVSGRLHA